MIIEEPLDFCLLINNSSYGEVLLEKVFHI